MHDIFIKIWQKKEIYSVEEGLKTYLFRSVQNACLDYLKHKSIEMTYADEVARRLKIEEIDYYNQSDAAELEKERLDSVYREIAKLPDRCREVFTLAYVDGKKSVEIAGMLNISQRTVEAQLYKGLKIIRNVLALLALVLFLDENTVEYVSKKRKPVVYIINETENGSNNSIEELIIRYLQNEIQEDELRVLDARIHESDANKAHFFGALRGFLTLGKKWRS